MIPTPLDALDRLLKKKESQSSISPGAYSDGKILYISHRGREICRNPVLALSLIPTIGSIVVQDKTYKNSRNPVLALSLIPTIEEMVVTRSGNLASQSSISPVFDSYLPWL